MSKSFNKATFIQEDAYKVHCIKNAFPNDFFQTGIYQAQIHVVQYAM